jgi:cell wall-associated NlpC family hydrolase
VRVDGHSFLLCALGHAGAPYLWGHKGPDAFDCSGLVTYSLWEAGGPDWRFTEGDCAHLWGRLEAYLPPEPVAGVAEVPVGMLAFYGPPHRADHVMVSAPSGQVFGATGGGRQTVRKEPGACVQYKPHLLYRPDFKGWRQLPEALHG